MEQITLVCVLCFACFSLTNFKHLGIKIDSVRSRKRSHFGFCPFTTVHTDKLHLPSGFNCDMSVITSQHLAHISIY